MIAAESGAGLVVVLLCSGIAWCVVRCMRAQMGVRQRYDETHKRWWER